MNALLPVLLTFGALYQASQSEIVLEKRRPLVLWQRVAIPEPEFTMSKLQERFHKLLEGKGAQLRVLQVEVYIDRREAINGNLKGRTDVTYQVWRELYRDYEDKIPPSAELLMINGNAAVRMRDQGGHITSVVLQGSNPYVIHAGGRDFELLHLAIGEGASLAASQERKEELTQIFTWYLVSKAHFDVSMARDATASLRREVGLGETYVLLRSDPWFITDDSFPIVSPYAESVRAPTKAEYERAPQVSCVGFKDTVNCSRP